MSDNVKVTISADASGFTQPLSGASSSAQRLGEAMKAAGGNLSKINPEFVATGQGAILLADAIKQASAASSTLTASLNPTIGATQVLGGAILGAAGAIRQGTVEFAGLVNANLGVDRAFRSAADSAAVFVRALNPTPLQTLRGLMGSEVPAAFRLTQTATQSVINSIFALDGSFKSAQASADVFMRALNPAPLSGLRAMMAESLPAASRITTASIHDAITAGTGLNSSFKSAADSAHVFTAALDPSPLKAFRDAVLSGDAANRVSATSIHDAIAAATGLGSGFKSAAESASVFTRALNPAPLRAYRDGIAAADAANRVTVSSIHDAIAASTGLGAGFKSAADSASVFAREAERIPLATLRDNLALVSNTGSLFYQSLQQNIDAANGIGASLKKASESATIFNAALDPTPLRQLRDLMAADVPAAANQTAVNFQAVIDASTGVDRAFKSAQDSASVFMRALDPTPLRQLRTLMAEDLTQAAAQVSVNFKEIIETSTGVGRAFKSASDSADVFTREINRIPLANLRRTLGQEIPAAAKATVVNFQAVIDASTGVSRGFRSAADSAQVFNQALDPSPLQRMRQLLAEEIPAGAEKTSHGTSAITREFIVLGHEALVGNWTRIPGTLLVMTEYSETLRNAIANLVTSFTAMQAVGVGAVVAVAGAFAYLIVKAHEATIAINEATSAATMQGRSPVEARKEMEAYGASMRDVGLMSESAMTQVSSSISQLSELTAAQKQKLADIATPMFLNFNKDAKKTGEEIAQIFASTGSLDSYLQKQHLLSTEQQSAWAAATTAAQKYDIGIAAVSARLSSINAQIKEQTAEARTNMLRAMSAGAEGSPFVDLQGQGRMSTPKALGDFEPGTKQADPGKVADTQAVIEGNKHLQEKFDLEARLEAQKRALISAEAAGDTTAANAARSAISATTAQLQMWKAAGDASWAAKQQEALSIIEARIASTATNSRTMEQDLNKARIAFWTQAANQSGLTEAQITQARANANRARIALAGEELRGNAAAAKESLAVRLATLKSEQDANRDNFAKVMQIEEQKLALLRSAGAMGAKLLAEEEGVKANLLREEAARVARVRADELGKLQQENASALAERKSMLDDEVLLHHISKQQELADLRAFAAEKHVIELAGYQQLLDSLKAVPHAYEEMYNKITAIQARWRAEDAKFLLQSQQDMEQRWNASTAPVQSAMASQLGAVLRGSSTINQAFVRMLGDIIIGYAEMAAKAGLHLLMLQAMQIYSSITGQAGATAATASGVSARNAISATEGAAQNAGLLVQLGRWIATQFGMTAASTAQSGTRIGAMATEQAAATQINGAAARLSIAAAAAVAAAWAFADSAMLGPPGLAAAPAAAVAAEASVMAFQAAVPSLAVGAWNIPRDMPANLHAGEMVVPASFAEGMRGAGVGGNQTLNYQPRVQGGSADLSGQMRAQSQMFKSYLWHATRNGALTVPGR